MTDWNPGDGVRYAGKHGTVIFADNLAQKSWVEFYTQSSSGQLIDNDDLTAEAEPGYIVGNIIAFPPEFPDSRLFRVIQLELLNDGQFTRNYVLCKDITFTGTPASGAYHSFVAASMRFISNS